MTLQEQIRSNQLRTIFVLFGFAAIVALLGMAVGFAYDPAIGWVVLVIGLVYGVWSYWSSGRIVARSAGARPVAPGEAPALVNLVDTLSIAAGLAKTPEVYIFDDPAPNAFAAGRTPETAYLAFSTGLLAMMDKRELEGVIAHELAHVRNRDVRLMTLATVMVGVIMLASDLLLRTTMYGGTRRRGNDGGMNIVALVVALAAAILAPIAAVMLQMALSRRREFLADASAVEIIGDANGLARALEKLAHDTQPLRKVTRATAHMYIESPLRDHVGLRSSLGGMFDTHPPLEERIERLRSLGAAV